MKQCASYFEFDQVTYRLYIHRNADICIAICNEGAKNEKYFSLPNFIKLISFSKKFNFKCAPCALPSEAHALFWSYLCKYSTFSTSDWCILFRYISALRTSNYYLKIFLFCFRTQIPIYTKSVLLGVTTMRNSSIN